MIYIQKGIENILSCLFSKIFDINNSILNTLCRTVYKETLCSSKIMGNLISFKEVQIFVLDGRNFTAMNRFFV